MRMDRSGLSDRPVQQGDPVRNRGICTIPKSMRMGDVIILVMLTRHPRWGMYAVSRRRFVGIHHTASVEATEQEGGAIIMYISS